MMNTGTSGQSNVGGGSQSQSSQFEDEHFFRQEAQRYVMESGEYERFIKMLQTKLTTADWNDRVNKCCYDLLMEVGVDNITLDQLFERIFPKARDMVPGDVKHEMLDIIQKSLEKHFNIR